ncbi:MAG: hypothetical protein AB8G86_01250 [Saprospiraceae bacterium]
MKNIITILTITLFAIYSYGQKPRARDLGVPFVGTTGTFNAITDVNHQNLGDKKEMGQLSPF